jgi:hypothetical protein
LDHRDAGRVRTAIARKVFTRAFKRDVRLPESVATTERLLEQAALDALAISHKLEKRRSDLPMSARRSPATASGR